MPQNAVYFATKSFIANFTLAVRQELEDTPVSLTLVCPGFTATGAHVGADYDTSWIPGWLWSKPETVAQAALRRRRWPRGLPAGPEITQRSGPCST